MDGPQLPAQAIHEVDSLGPREHFPGIRFELEVRSIAERGDGRDRLGHGPLRGAERAETLRIDRNVKMNSPLIGIGEASRWGVEQTLG